MDQAVDELLLNLWYKSTLVGNTIFDHSDVVGA